MAKMRGIKPETWTDEKFVSVSPLARLLFIAMWTEACDNGHVEDSPVQLKIRLLPMDSCDVAGLIGELVTHGLLERGAGYVKVVNLPAHQRIDKRFLSLCEHCVHDENTTYTEADRPTRSSSTRSAPDVRTTSTPSAHVDEGEGEGEGEGELKVKPARKRARQLPANWKPIDSHITKAFERGVNIDHEVEQFRSYHEARATTFVDWDKAFHNWLGKAFPDRRIQQESKVDRARRERIPESWL